MTVSPVSPPQPPDVAHLLRTAEVRASHRGARLTEMRRQVLCQLARAEGPVSAYELLERVDWGTRKRVPMQIYRALDFLIEIGLAHKVATLSAFLMCRSPDACALSHFLICRHCHRVDEVEDGAISRAVHAVADARSFADTGLVVEISGVCRACDGHAAAKAVDDAIDHG